MNTEKIRKETKGCEQGIFLNSAGSSLMPGSVVAKMKAYLDEEERLGGYTTAKKNEKNINEFYKEIARLINCKPSNIAFAYNATDAFSRALSSVPFRKNDTILTTHDDYSSNEIAFLSLQKRLDIKILKANNLKNGSIDLNHFKTLALNKQPKLVAVTHIPTNSGLIQPAEAIGAICKEHNIWYLLDACQSVGQIPVDVSVIQCDFLSVTGRKFLRGPRGTGFLYVSEKALSAGLEPMFIDTRGADLIDHKNYKVKDTAMRFETWEFSYMSLIGLAQAVKYLNDLGIQKVFAYNKELMQNFRQGLHKIKDLHLLDMGSELSNILTFYKENSTLTDMRALLDLNKVDYTVSYKNYAAYHLIKAEIDWVIRLSPHYFNTMEEVNQVVEILRNA